MNLLIKIVGTIVVVNFVAGVATTIILSSKR